MAPDPNEKTEGWLFYISPPHVNVDGKGSLKFLFVVPRWV